MTSSARSHDRATTVLRAIAAREPTTTAQLAGAVGLDQETVRQVAVRLIADGLVQRARVGQRAGYQLSPAGRAEAGHVPPAPQSGPRLRLPMSARMDPRWRRRRECAHYDDCLDEAARADAGCAGCPPLCSRWQEPEPRPRATEYASSGYTTGGL